MVRMADKEKTVKIAARIPAKLHKILKMEAAEREIPLNEMICLALSQAKPIASPKSVSR